MKFSINAIDAYYNGDLDGTALGEKMRGEELEEEMGQEFRNGEFN